MDNEQRLSVKSRGKVTKNYLLSQLLLGTEEESE